MKIPNLSNQLREDIIDYCIKSTKTNIEDKLLDNIRYVGNMTTFYSWEFALMPINSFLLNRVLRKYFVETQLEAAYANL